MWTRDLLKMNAKQVLRNNYWMALLVAFVASLIAGGSSNIGPTLTFKEPLNKSPSFSAERENRRLPLGSSDSVGK